MRRRVRSGLSAIGDPPMWGEPLTGGSGGSTDDRFCFRVKAEVPLAATPASAREEKLRRESHALDYPCVVARNESGHRSDFRETHVSGLEMAAADR